MSDSYESRARLFRTLGHPARLQILDILAVEPGCVYSITRQLGCRQAYASQQLAVLREAGLVIAERDGIKVRYRLVSAGLWHLLQNQSNLKTYESPLSASQNGI